MLRRLITAAALALLATQASAQTGLATPGVFENYNAMRAEVDPLVSDLRIQTLLPRIADTSQMDTGEIMALEIQMRNALRDPLTEVEVMMLSPLENGFRREILAYHDGGTGYLYLLLMIHEREDDLVVLHMLMNTSLAPLLSLF
ncbi:hypothetical protein [Gymnodinialimonas hymeniacidonis]|uniref:hypothetical protein n=1 Tax=Gymnodinialimonas hymeniacidonis TaxID=3126508 RepID=UPI0034C62FDD